MINPVAQISYDTANYLKLNFPDLDIQVDGNCNLIIHQGEAKLLLSEVEDYTVLDFIPAYIGAPRPKKRKL